MVDQGTSYVEKFIDRLKKEHLLFKRQKALLLAANWLFILSLAFFVLHHEELHFFAILFFIISLYDLYFKNKQKNNPIPLTASALRFDLQLLFPDLKSDFFLWFSSKNRDCPKQKIQEFKSILAKYKNTYLLSNKEKMRPLREIFHSSVLCLIFFVVFDFKLIQPFLTRTLISTSLFSPQATLFVHKGAEIDEKKALNIRANNPAALKLNQDNLIEVQLKTTLNTIPELQLKSPQNGEILQRFLLEKENSNFFSLRFSLRESSDIFIPSISPDKALAKIIVDLPPYPQVKLTLLSIPDNKEGYFLDSENISLAIESKAQKGLLELGLLIQEGENTSVYPIRKFENTREYRFSTDLNINLAPYLENDFSEISLTVKALDLSQPKPLQGLSNPVLIKLSSSYGQYQLTLRSLRELKELLDTSIKQNTALAKDELSSKDKEIKKYSVKTPFFDALDRINLQQILHALITSKENEQMIVNLNTSEQLGDFLNEHENLDDRERDRDFFVAARAISRLLTSQEENIAKVTRAFDNLGKFITNRHKRWVLRVGYLRNPPSLWQEKVKNESFKKDLEKIAKLKNEEAITALGKISSEYQNWLEALENAEDTERKEKEEDRNQSLLSASNQLRKLQVAQGEISKDLDLADKQKKELLEEHWPMLRLKQNSNLQDTKKIESMLQALAPEASYRIQIAAKAMQQTLEHGNNGEFAHAESNSDLAGRLLRKAENANEKAKQKNQTSRGTRKRSGGNQYYGKNVQEADIELRYQGYEVDRRYREAILEEVEKNENLHSDEQKTLNEYLKKVVR